MISKIEFKNEMDEKTGRITSGWAKGPGINISWADGARSSDVETVLDAVKIRLESFQVSKDASREVAIAINKLDEALMWLAKRFEVPVNGR